MCDAAAPCLLEVKNWVLDPQKIPQGFPVDDDVALGTWSGVFNQLYTDGYIKEALLDKDGTTYFILSTQGRIFLERGGYVQLFAEQTVLHELELQQKSSVIDTNDAVQKSMKFQKENANRTLLAIWVSAGIAVCSVIVAVTSTQDKKIQTELQRQVKSLDSLRLSLNEMNREAKRAKRDTVKISITK